WRQYIPEHAKWPEAEAFFINLFKGKVLNKWIMQQTTAKELLQSNQFIIKFCRGNALLPYLTHHFHFVHKPILLVRHPFAVVASQLKHGSWNHIHPKFTIPEAPYHSHYKEHEAFCKTLTTQAEILTSYWCLTNQIPLRHAKNNID